MSFCGKYHWRTADFLPTFAFSWQPNFTQGFVLRDDKHNGSHFSPCGTKTCQPLQETTSCYLQTTPSILLSSVIMCAAMHGSRILPFYISCTTKRQPYRAFHTILAHSAIREAWLAYLHPLCHRLVPCILSSHRFVISSIVNV